MSSIAVLDRLLDPLGETFTVKSAKALVALRADRIAQARIDELGERNRGGTLSREEKAELDSYVSAGALIAILQAKARAFLKRHSRKR